jgi:hypothetical protein
LTAPGRSEHPPVRKEREILGKANQNLLDTDLHSHGRPYRSKPSPEDSIGKRSKLGFMAMWKKIAITVVAWVVSVLVYVEFFKAR